ncbi:stage II sporulation protein E [Tissierella sp. Yu-01]|uniref:stage II sporulation protein E n=1 Tax=Tissierella sp. Yu-01 TaxID=3035694 RepID=UPI00240D69FA|nr:stage II sporulation protein E [Tissierella sp. Yu-01]WFA07729.1 stage II sporulation protein E [Tissierella sp. Yu-01]
MARMESVISKNKLDLRIEMHTVLLIIISFLLGRVNILDRLYPFGIAFIGAYTIFKQANKGILAATILGTISAQGLGSLSYIITSLLIYVFFTRNRENSKYSLIVSSMIVAGIFTVMRLIGLNFSESLAIYDMILIVFEGILVFTMTYVFSFSFPIEELGNSEVSNEKMVCTFITMALVLSGISNMSIMGASLKNIVCIVSIISLAYSQGIYMGGITGIILGMVAYISNVEMPFIIAMLAVGGILSGLFREIGKSGAIIGFFLGNGIISYYVNGLGTSFLGYEELLVSSIIFLVFYNKIEKTIDDVFKSKSKIKKELENRKFELASRRLSHTSDLLESISKTFKNTMENDDVFSSSQIYTIVDDVKVNMCQSCKNFSNCWEKENYATYYSLFTTVGVLESEVEDKDKLISSLLEKCEDVDSLTIAIKNIYRRYKERENIITKINEQKLVLVEQLEGLSKLVDDINIDIYMNATFNEELEELLEKEIKDKRIDIKEVIYAQLPSDNIEIYVEFDSNNTIDKVDRVTRIVSNSLGYTVAPDYSLGSIEKTNRFKLIRCNRYGALTKVSEEPNSKNGISGDSYTYGEIENIAYAALSDGMGTGKKANIESMIAIEILEKMMEINADKEMTIKTINNVLRTKARDEMFTTLDISFVDLYKGKLQLIKSGACPTFIKKKDEVKVINSMSLPIGILKDVDFNIYEENIEDGDMIIMMSDGVLECSREHENPEAWMKKVIDGLDAQNPQTIADEILQIAKMSSKNNIGDDMTILVTKVWRNNN